MVLDYIFETGDVKKNIVTFENRIPIDFDDDFFYFDTTKSGWQLTVPLYHAINHLV